MPALPSIQPPVLVLMGSPGQATRLIATLRISDITCFQMDVYQAERLRAKLADDHRSILVKTSADLWDLPADFQTVLYPTTAGAERSLKLDMVEQAFHVLRPHGVLVVYSPFPLDDFFPKVLKKIFGRVHSAPGGAGQTFWCRRDKERQRRRHEMTVHVRLTEGQTLEFLSRPGVFTFGRFDAGARALVETMTIDPGDRILDMGCGYGSVGIAAAIRSGSTGSVTFVDSNLRALSLAEHNAIANGVSRFAATPSDRIGELSQGSFDVALANPPYYALLTIARHFVKRCSELLRHDGRLYLVSKQAEQSAPILSEHFSRIEVVTRRGYAIFTAKGPKP